MTLQELKAYRIALHEKLSQLNRIVPACKSCEHFLTGTCEKFGATPPDEFQKTPEACAEWVYDQIPF